MRLCAHVRFNCGNANHQRRNGLYGTSLTPDGMLICIACHTSGSKMLNPLLDLWRISVKGLCRNAFPASITIGSHCKYTTFFLFIQILSKNRILYTFFHKTTLYYSKG